MANGMCCGLEVNEFELKSRYIHFRTNTLGKGMKLFIPNYELNITTTVVLQEWL